MKTQNLDRKRLLYSSQHRGMKEMDLILGSFARQHIPSMTEEELAQFDQILAFSDQELYGCVFGDRMIQTDLRKMLLRIKEST